MPDALDIILSRMPEGVDPFGSHEDGSLSVLTGRLGGGKTYHGVAAIVAELGKRPIVTNIALSPWFADAFGVKVITDAEAVEFPSHSPAGSLVVIDEAHHLFASRGWASNAKELLSYFRMVRKYGDKVIIITQAVGDIDSHIRQVVGSFVSAWSPGALVIGRGRLADAPILNRLARWTVLTSYDNKGGRRGDMMSQRWHRFDRRIYALYNSYATHAVAAYERGSAQCSVPAV